MWNLIKKIPHLLSAVPSTLLILCTNTSITVHRKIMKTRAEIHMNILLQTGPE